MNRIKSKFRQLKFWLKHNFFTVENVVLIVAILLCLTWTYQSILAMSRNWELSEKITAEKKELELLTVEVESMELENEYLQSDEYQDLMARKYLDKKNPGENMVVLPENSEEAKNKHQTVVAIEAPEKEYSNFDKWLRYLFPSY